MAINKAMALIERHQPKDVFDIYFLLTKKKIKPEILLEGIKKKFGVTISLSLFWSQALLASRELERMQLLLFGTKKQQKELIEEIKIYFEDKAAQFLRPILE